MIKLALPQWVDISSRRTAYGNVMWFETWSTYYLYNNNNPTVTTVGNPLTYGYSNGTHGGYKVN